MNPPRAMVSTRPTVRCNRGWGPDRAARGCHSRASKAVQERCERGAREARESSDTPASRLAAGQPRAGHRHETATKSAAAISEQCVYSLPELKFSAATGKRRVIRLLRN